MVLIFLFVYSAISFERGGTLFGRKNCALFASQVGCFIGGGHLTWGKLLFLRAYYPIFNSLLNKTATTSK